MIHRLFAALSLALVPGMLSAAPPATRGIAALRDPVRLVEAGRDLEARGQFSQAMGFYDQALSVDPANVPALTAAGANALRRGDGAEAFAYYTALTRILPQEGGTWLGLGAALVLRLQPEEALAALAEADKRGAAPAKVASQRGVAHDLAGDHRAAQVAYGSALAAEPGNVEAARRLALSLAVTGARPAALQVMRRFESDQANAVALRQTLAMIYALTGDPGTADEIAATILPREEAKAMSAFFRALPPLSTRDKTIAALFGRLPGAQAAAMNGGRAIEPPSPPPPPEPKRVTMTAPAPERLWIQLASVSDPARLHEAWAEIAKAGGPDLRNPKTADGPKGHRLLIGPYASRAAANEAVVRLKARGVSTFPVTTAKGTLVNDVEPAR